MDGSGTNAAFYEPYGVVIDASGNLFVTDFGGHRIRKIDPLGNVTTFAGSGLSGTADGQGTIAQFNEPHAITIDSAGNLYVAT